MEQFPCDVDDAIANPVGHDVAVPAQYADCGFGARTMAA